MIGEMTGQRLKVVLVAELLLLAMALVLPFMPSKSPGGPMINRPESLGAYATSVLLVWLAINGILAVVVAFAVLHRYLRKRIKEE